MKRQRSRVILFSAAILFAFAITTAIAVPVARRRHHRHHESPPPLLDPVTAAAATSSSWDAQVPNLRNYSSKDLARFVAPLVGMSGNAYGFASEVRGWKASPRIAPLAPSAPAGAHALVYEQDAGGGGSATTKIVVAFRGTLSRADLCADRLLFGDIPRMSLPDPRSCLSAYGNADLDYVSQAVSYTRRVVAAYPRGSTSLLLTGHSLGGALAVLVAASMAANATTSPGSMAAVGFSSPGSGGAMAARSIEMAADMRGKVVVIGDEWDSVVTALWAQQRGTVCLVQRPQPSDCAACRGSGGDCSQCMFEAHSLTGILDKLQSGDKFVCSDH